MADLNIEEISEFITSDKFLDGLCPSFGEGFGGMFQTRWDFVDALGIGLQSHLCISLKESLDRPSISALYRGHPIYRLDIVPDHVEKPNPPWASKFGLPNYVSGCHTHPWEQNKDFVEKNWDKSLPAREPLQESMSTLEHALAQVTDDLNISITGEQRVVSLPPQGRFLG